MFHILSLFCQTTDFVYSVILSLFLESFQWLNDSLYKKQTAHLPSFCLFFILSIIFTFVSIVISLVLLSNTHHCFFILVSMTSWASVRNSVLLNFIQQCTVSEHNHLQRMHACDSVMKRRQLAIGHANTFTSGNLYVWNLLYGIFLSICSGVGLLQHMVVLIFKSILEIASSWFHKFVALQCVCLHLMDKYIFLMLSSYKNVLFCFFNPDFFFFKLNLELL